MQLKTLLSIVCIAAIAPGMCRPATQSESWSLIEFPFVAEISPGKVLVVHGHVFRDEVLFTWTPGDSLRVQGLPIEPRPPVPPRVLSEEELASAYGRVDYIRERVDSGYTWREAIDAWHQKTRKEIQAARARYGAALDSTGSEVKAAKAVSDSFDHSLLNPRYEPIVTLTHTSIEWQGGLTDHSMPRLEPAGVVSDIEDPILREFFRKKTEKELAQLRTRFYAKWLDGPGTCLVLISPRGDCIFCGEDALRAFAQMDEVKSGRFSEGPIDETELKRIMEAEAPK